MDGVTTMRISQAQPGALFVCRGAAELLISIKKGKSEIDTVWLTHDGRILKQNYPKKYDTVNKRWTVLVT